MDNHISDAEFDQWAEEAGDLLKVAPNDSLRRQYIRAVLKTFYGRGRLHGMIRAQKILTGNGDGVDAH